MADDTLKEFEHLRNMAENSFNEIFLNASRLAKKFDVPIVIPRITKHQRNRINYPSNSPEEYYRISIFIPFLDSFILEINQRFVNHKTTSSGFSDEITSSNNKFPIN